MELLQGCGIQGEKLFAFQSSKSLKIPEGFSLQLDNPPTPRQLNRLFSRCNTDTYSPKKLAIALQNSFCNLSIFEDKNSQLMAFVRITSDKGLNANLWDLVAVPGGNQQLFLSILINQSLLIIKRNLPGCSISLAAPSIAIKYLEDEGFLIDPSGIRTMAYRIR